MKHISPTSPLHLPVEQGGYLGLAVASVLTRAYLPPTLHTPAGGA